MSAKSEHVIKHVMILRSGEPVPSSGNSDTAIIVVDADARAGNRQVQKLAAVGFRVALFVGDPEKNEADAEVLQAMIAELFPNSEATFVAKLTP